MQIDGKAINQQIGESLNNTINHLGKSPSLGILCVGSDPASLSFIKVKKSFGEKYGFVVDIVNLDESQSLEIIKETLVALQQNHDAVIVQLPLPEKFKENTDEILTLIENKKDVDDLNGGNFEAPIVLALEKVFNSLPSDIYQKIKTEGIIGIVGLGQVVGIPIKNYLEKNGFNIETIKRGEMEKIKNCDVVISGVGQPFLITGEFIKDGAVLVDYGCSFILDPRGSGLVACGDFDHACFEKAKYYTPVPGCMGPLVVASLFENVLKSKI